MRPYYVEGSKTLVFEILEQLNWTVPDVLVIPVGSGAMLNSICKGFEEIMDLGIISDISNLRIIAAQPHGCSPIVDAYKNKSNEVVPVRYPILLQRALQ